MSVNISLFNKYSQNLFWCLGNMCLPICSIECDKHIQCLKLFIFNSKEVTVKWLCRKLTALDAIFYF